MSCCSAALWLLVNGASGELADGFCKAVVMSWMPGRTRSMDDAVDMGTLVGSQVHVSQMCCACVSIIQTV